MDLQTYMNDNLNKKHDHTNVYSCAVVTQLT